MKILVTGADGYLGTGIVRELLNAGHEVHGFGLGPSPECESGGFLYTQESAFNLGSSGIAEISPDIVLHLAWRNGFKHGEPSHIEDLPGHYRFVRDCVEARVPRLAVMGSMHEVGYHEGQVTSDTPCSPTTPYAIAKNALRQLSFAECAGSKTELLWMRAYYIVSSDGRGDSIFAKIIAADREGKKLFPFTSGKNKYDFLDYGDFCTEVVRTVMDAQQAGIVNVCSGVPESLGSRVEDFIIQNGLSIRLDYGAFPDRKYDSPAIWGAK